MKENKLKLNKVRCQVMIEQSDITRIEAYANGNSYNSLSKVLAELVIAGLDAKGY